LALDAILELTDLKLEREPFELVDRLEAAKRLADLLFVYPERLRYVVDLFVIYIL
jgi:hypothetical protein